MFYIIMFSMKNKIIIVSACLLGLNTKYNGGNNENRDVIALSKRYILIPLCPEQLGGLPTPRPPSEIKGNSVFGINGSDLTTNFLRGAEEALKFAKLYNVKKAILKDGSPSCGSNYIYDGTFTGKKIEGSGITAMLFKRNNIRVYSEKEIGKFLADEEKE